MRSVLPLEIAALVILLPRLAFTQTTTGPVSATGACTAVLIGSSAQSISLQGCGTSDWNSKFFSAMEARANEMVRSQKMTGRRLQSVAEDLNVWLPALGAQLEQSQAEWRGALDDLKKLVTEAIQRNKPDSELSRVPSCASEEKIRTCPEPTDHLNSQKTSDNEYSELTARRYQEFVLCMARVAGYAGDCFGRYGRPYPP